MKNLNPLTVGLVILLVGVGVLSYFFSSGCGSGWIQLSIGQTDVCSENVEPPCPNPADCVRDVAKLVSVEAYPVQAKLEYVNQPDLADWLNPLLAKLGLEEKFFFETHPILLANLTPTPLNDML
jgi:hypothetical protein